MNTSELKEFAQLAQAAYAHFASADFVANDPGQESVIKKLQSAPNAAFPESQAKMLTGRYEVVHQFTDGGLNGGFSATVFRDKSDPNRLILSFRGTEFNGDIGRDLLITDLRIGLDGYASPQAVPMYRYIKQLQTPPGQPVQYSEEEIRNLFYLNAGIVVDLTNAVQINKFVDFRARLLADTGIDAGQGDGKALFDAGKEIDLTGHSLGGHLAMLAQRLFPQKFDDVVTYNAAGFFPDSLLSRFGEWDEGKILRIESVGDGVSELGTRHPGSEMLVGMETRPVPANAFSANHSIANIADGLALTELLGKLDPRFTSDPRVIRPLLDSASNMPVSTYEKILDSIRVLILGKDQTATQYDDLGKLGPSRESLYSNMASLVGNAKFISLEGKLNVEILSTANVSGLVTRTKEEFGILMALQFGLPFALKGQALEDVWRTTHPDLFAMWQTDQNLPAHDDKGVRNFSDHWLTDRAMLLRADLQANIRDFNYRSNVNPLYVKGIGSNPIDFIIRGATSAEDYVVKTLPEGVAPQNRDEKYLIGFGSDGDDKGERSLTGAGGNDRFYGGDGNDELNGEQGNDYLEGNSGNDKILGGDGKDEILGGDGDDELTGNKHNDIIKGGAGNDTYKFTSGDGWDTVIDSDGQGAIVIDGITLTGGKEAQLGSKLWESEAVNGKKFQFVLITESDGTKTLHITSGTDRIYVKNYTDGKLGITLQDGTPAVPPTTGRTIVGDLAPIDFDLTTPGTQYSYDNLNNVLTNGQLEPDRADALYDSTGNDLIQAGGGSDFIGAVHGGNDRLEGGAGQDAIFGGTGDDVILGGADGDVSGGGDGNDRLYSEAEIDLSDAIEFGLSQTATGNKGDWLNGGAGEDIVVAGADNDALFGAGGRDILVGGAGEDVLNGDDDYLPISPYFFWSITEYDNTFVQTIPACEFREYF